ncbi:unnamed protein product [Hermetia illucens]|uniref:Tetraspanin n=1 Tax=Hermetia illucens TaxID=343691 RepID=A0A7R8YRE4_HERIL|nr:23 kDa integral membrane protein-like [Hermetia illucens]CAD7082638.1 unnamed protein product [Hermetia illucens]
MTGICLPKAVLTIFLFIFNVAFLICGIAAIAVGVIATVETDTFRSIREISSDFESEFICYGLIASGVFLLVVAIFGFVAISREDKAWALVYAICMIILLAMNIALSVYVLRWRNTLQRGEVREKLIQLWDHKNGSFLEISDNKLKAAKVYLIQRKFKCCGIDGPEDYEQKDSTKQSGKPLPVSCCPKISKKCSSDLTYHVGCNQAIEDMLRKYSHYIQYVPILLAILVALATIFAICYASRLLGLGGKKRSG